MKLERLDRTVRDAAEADLHMLGIGRYRGGVGTLVHQVITNFLSSSMWWRGGINDSLDRHLFDMYPPMLPPRHLP